MDRTDESIRKPRRTRGTPSYFYRNRFAYAVIAVGTAIFAICSVLPPIRQGNEAFFSQLREPTVEEIERRALFSLPAARTSRAIQETIDDKKKLISER